MSDDGHLRASDADRDRAVAELRTHHDDGRLSVEDLEQRVAAAYAAVTWGELNALFADLPGRAPAPAARTAPPTAGAGGTAPAPPPLPGAPGPPAPPLPALPVPPALGSHAFAYTSSLDVPPDVALSRAAEHIGPRLVARGYELTGHLPQRLTYTRTRVPSWAWAVAIVLPGPGFLAPLLATREPVHIHIDATPDGSGGSAFVIHGIAPRRIRRALAALSA